MVEDVEGRPLLSVVWLDFCHPMMEYDELVAQSMKLDCQYSFGIGQLLNLSSARLFRFYERSNNQKPILKKVKVIL